MEEADKVWTAAYHLVDNAQFWYLQFERDHGITSWQHFKEACHLQFGPSVRANPLGELAQLPITPTVADYTSRFMALLCRTSEPLSSAQQRFLYTTGLPEGLKVDVELQQLGPPHGSIPR